MIVEIKITTTKKETYTHVHAALINGVTMDSTHHIRQAIDLACKAFNCPLRSIKTIKLTYKE